MGHTPLARHVSIFTLYEPPSLPVFAPGCLKITLMDICNVVCDLTDSIETTLSPGPGLEDEVIDSVLTLGSCVKVTGYPPTRWKKFIDFVAIAIGTRHSLAVVASAAACAGSSGVGIRE